jgi:CelD/BcsL family acetyltransferase involved in cellulose biosynthesis
MAALEIALVTALADLESLRPEWSHLWQDCPEATPFQSPAWLLAWWRHLGGGELRVITLRAAGRLVGMAPLFLHVWEGQRQLSPLGISISDYTDFLILPRFVGAGTALILEYLERRRAEWDVFVMPDLPEGAPLLALPIPDTLSALREPAAVCPVIALPKAVSDWHARLPTYRRRQIKHGWQWLEKNGGAEIERATPAALNEFMDALFQWHARRWQGRGEPGMLATAELKALHREVAAGLQNCGTVRLYGLRFQGVLRAALYVFAKGGRTYVYLDGFDPSVGRVSPVHLLMAHAIEEAIREGDREFDLLRGQEPHKYVWGAQDRQNYRLTLFSNAG